MGRRHQSSRRKVYGRRQHEVRERHDRHHHPEAFELEGDAWSAPGYTDPLGSIDPRRPRLHYVGE